MSSVRVLEPVLFDVGADDVLVDAGELLARHAADERAASLRADRGHGVLAVEAVPLAVGSGRRDEQQRGGERRQQKHHSARHISGVGRWALRAVGLALPTRAPRTRAPGFDHYIMRSYKQDFLSRGNPPILDPGPRTKKGSM